MKTLLEQIACARRELALRKNVYPNLLLRGKLNANEVRHQIECMEAIIDTLEKLNRDTKPQPDLL